jgi:hypothetical protein
MSDELFHHLRANWRSSDAKEMRQAFARLHRTEQQNVIRNIVEILDEAACAYQDDNVDLRNKASFEWAYTALEIDHHFPYV